MTGQCFDRLALLAFAEQRGDRHAEELPQQIEQRRLERRHGVDRRAQVERLRATSTGIAIGEAPPHLAENTVEGADRVADDERPGVIERLPDALAAGNLADASASGVVLEDHDVSSEERAVRAAQVEQHAVVARDRDDEHLGDDRCGRRRVFQHQISSLEPSVGRRSPSGGTQALMFLAARRRLDVR